MPLNEETEADVDGLPKPGVPEGTGRSGDAVWGAEGW